MITCHSWDCTREIDEGNCIIVVMTLGDGRHLDYYCDGACYNVDYVCPSCDP